MTVNGEPVAVEATLDSEGFDVMNGNYTVCDTNGNTRTVTVDGWSVSRLFQAAGVTADEVSSVSVPRIASSGSVVLHPGDYDATSFHDGPALIESRTSMGSVSTADDFLRPYRGMSCASDPNANDYVITPVDTPLTVQIASGTQLQVSDAVDHASLPAGADATFTASVSGASPGEALTYRWQFGDGSLGSGQTVSHAFAGAGSYQVLLTVDSGAAAGGAAAPLTVTVGSAAGPAGAGRTPQAKTTRRGTTASTAPAHTVASSRAPTQAPRPSAAPSPVEPVAAGPAVTAPSLTPSVAAAAPAPDIAPTMTPSPTPSAQPASAPPAGELVSGRSISLLAPAGAAAQPSASSPLQALQQALGPHGTAAPSASHDWAPVAAAAGLALCLGVGAAAELLPLRRMKR